MTASGGPLERRPTERERPACSRSRPPELERAALEPDRLVVSSADMNRYQVEVLGLVHVELAVDRLTVESSRCGRGLGSSGQKTKVL